MDRRHFLQHAVSAALAPYALSGLTNSLLGNTLSPLGILDNPDRTDRVLVVIQLNGGNDGLNMVIPNDQYSSYYNLRSNIAIPQNQLLSLNGSSTLHPAMTRMKELYDDGKLAVLSGVGYASQNFSHFRSMDIWNTASNSSEVLESGWLGRFLETEFDGYPIGYPNSSMIDPLAIQIGSSVSLSLQGDSSRPGLALTDPNTFFSLVSGTDTQNFTTVQNNQNGDMLGFVRQIQLESQAFSSQIKTASDKFANRYTYPSTGLANQLKIIARLIAGGLKTKVYFATIGGFDTHSDQVVSGSTSIGYHAGLLQQLSEAIHAFQNDLRMYGIEDKVVGMTYSEFGRRAISNASFGTDHGTSAPVFIFGKNVNPGVVGASTNLSLVSGGNLPLQFDFRSIYSSLMTQWFGSGQADLNTILLRNFSSLPIIKEGQALSMEVIRSHSLSRGDSYTYQIQCVTDDNSTAVGQVLVYDEVTGQNSTLSTDASGFVQYSTSVPWSKLSGRYYIRFGLPNGFFTAIEVIVP